MSVGESRMADKKQIIIDGVDVSECLFYQVNFEEDYDVKIKHFCSNWHNSCESINNSNCYFKQLARKTQECESLKEELNLLKNNEDLLLSELQVLWGKQIAEEQGDCRNIDYSKPRTREIYHKITEIDRTLKDVAFAQSVNIGKTKPLGDTGSPKSYRNWERREMKLLEREFLK